uniref:Uncharacterized protein n=1 Tax=viral metagenome TaxID=1070528 RepID=A0A6H1ZW71_9ZZZZ
MPEIGAPHKVTHQDGGNDEISLTGLSGLAGESQTPLAHKTSHQDGGTDEISVGGLAGRQIFVPYNAKIADINEADTNKHTLNLETALSETRKIIALIAMTSRVSGSSVFWVYPNEGTTGIDLVATLRYGSTLIIKDATQRLQYSQGFANDDWDLYCFGYVVEI